MKTIVPLWQQGNDKREISIIGLNLSTESISVVGKQRRFGHIGNETISFLTAITSNVGVNNTSQHMSHIGSSAAGIVG